MIETGRYASPTELAQAEKIYNQVSEEAPHLDPKGWESLMIDLLHRGEVLFPVLFHLLHSRGSCAPTRGSHTRSDL